MQNKAKEIEVLLSPVADGQGMEIVDVQYVKESGSRILRVFIDKADGISMDDCERMSHIIGAYLDDKDVLKESYMLEISSPGLNRVLKKAESFQRFCGENARIQTFNPINGQKNFFGEILGISDGKVKINDITNGTVEIEVSDIKKANLETDI